MSGSASRYTPMLPTTTSPVTMDWLRSAQEFCEFAHRRSTFGRSFKRPLTVTLLEDKSRFEAVARPEQDQELSTSLHWRVACEPDFFDRVNEDLPTGLRPGRHKRPFATGKKSSNPAPSTGYVDDECQ
jgi:hypothetical protein